MLAAAGAATIGAIEEAIKTDWVPVSIDMALSAATAEVLGVPFDRERARQSTLRSMRARLLAPVVEGVRKIFGLKPKPAIKMTQRGWHQIYRNCGSPVFVDVSETSASLIFEKMPAEALACADYLVSIAGGLHAILDICHAEGDVTVGEVDAEAQTVRFDFSWET